ncbi:acyl-CoA-binding domain-containing protein 6-like [Copidosoma floridanum]|uniref:acyl-CoA-binding domain-containing protein 6-like n=1 Tax=Copidosoma floridanum TaxID=29053 RepID=UPI0006C99777|nr:acyl-CoA-binding domain-containing protein 6-like [Copidosoma floridanum]
MAEGLRNAELSDLEETFNKAASYVQLLVSKLSNTQLLGFYGLYKQATCGPCDTPAPSWYQLTAKSKWEAWKSLGDMKREVAMSNYIGLVSELDPDWEKDARDSSKTWVVVSTLPNTDTELHDVDKTLLDWIKESNLNKVQLFLSRDKKCIEVRDEDNMLPIHWAADRGDFNILKFLVEVGSDINAQDADGQTPLHYAASCGHKDIIKYLLSKNARMIQDNDGLTPKDVADEAVTSMF